MWALRRAAIPLRSRGSSIGISRVSSAKLEILSPSIEENKVDTLESPQEAYDTCLSLKRFYHIACGSSKVSVVRHSFSSQARAKSSSGEDDSEDGFSELDMPSSAEANQDGNVEGENDEELISESKLSEDGVDIEEPSQNEMELLESETDPTEKKEFGKRAQSALFDAIMAVPAFSVHNALDKWAEEGNDLSHANISLAMLNLRKRRMYGKALLLSEWLETNKHLDFVESNYASRLDLIAKVHGLQKAENYIEKIPESFRGEVTYRTLLANCVVAYNIKKAEDVFNKMKDLDFPLTSFVCNQLLLLYKRMDKKKIGDVLLLMEKENVEPTLFTYKLLIDTKGRANDITSMDQIFQTMKAKGIEPDMVTKAILVKHYASGGLKEKAEAILKEMEGDNLKDHWVCRVLLRLYAQLGKADDVSRIWKVCESSPTLEDGMAAIFAWGKLNKIEKAEAVFDGMLKTSKKLSSRHYSELLKVYADHKMLAKGKDLIRRMVDSGCSIGPRAWYAIVKLYVDAGEVEKADSILQKAMQNQMRPLIGSYMAILEQYAKRGDIHNSEKLFQRMRQVGFAHRAPQFQALIQAYINAKAPAYGIRDRMKANNVFPNKALAAQLVQVDAFARTTLSDLLD